MSEPLKPDLIVEGSPIPAASPSNPTVGSPTHSPPMHQKSAGSSGATGLDEVATDVPVAASANPSGSGARTSDGIQASGPMIVPALLVAALAVVLITGAEVLIGLGMTAALTTALRVVHVATAIAAISGVTGRQLMMTQARRSGDIASVATMVRAAGRFENMLVIPGSLLLFAAGIALAMLEGWPLLGFLQGSESNWLLVSTLLYLALYPLIIFIFLPRGAVFGSALQQAVAQGQVTPALTAAFNDRVVDAAHRLEWAFGAAILYLMLVKPF